MVLSPPIITQTYFPASGRQKWGELVQVYIEYVHYGVSTAVYAFFDLCGSVQTVS